MLIGIWKNVDDLEENVSLPELIDILKADAEREHSQRKFAAALKGIDLDEGDEQATFEEVKRRAEARLAGKSEEELDFADLGIDYEG